MGIAEQVDRWGSSLIIRELVGPAGEADLHRETLVRCAAVLYAGLAEEVRAGRPFARDARKVEAYLDQAAAMLSTIGIVRPDGRDDARLIAVAAAG